MKALYNVYVKYQGENFKNIGSRGHPPVFWGSLPLSEDEETLKRKILPGSGKGFGLRSAHFFALNRHETPIDNSQISFMMKII